MLTEQDKQEQVSNEVQERIDFNNQVIVAAAKYEREISHKDFLEILNDMKRIVEVLDRELILLMKQIVVTDEPSERATVNNEMTTKMIRKIIIEEAISYPERIIHQAALAKEENIELKNKLKEKNNG